jgi:purine nucleosidase
VLGIVAVAGNVGLANNSRNALKVVELSGRKDIAVYAGYSRPMRRPLVTAEHVHGDSGLDGPTLPEPKLKLETKHGVDFIIQAIKGNVPAPLTRPNGHPLPQGERGPTSFCEPQISLLPLRDFDPAAKPGN